MAQEWTKKYLRMKPEVERIFQDLEDYRDYCALYMLKFDVKDLYRSEQYRKFEKYKNWMSRRAETEAQ